MKIPAIECVDEQVFRGRAADASISSLAEIDPQLGLTAVAVNDQAAIPDMAPVKRDRKCRTPLVAESLTPVFLVCVRRRLADRVDLSSKLSAPEPSIGRLNVVLSEGNEHQAHLQLLRRLCSPRDCVVVALDVRQSLGQDEEHLVDLEKSPATPRTASVRRRTSTIRTDHP